jgi:hypothetical protein
MFKKDMEPPVKPTYAALSRLIDLSRPSTSYVLEKKFKFEDTYGPRGTVPLKISDDLALLLSQHSKYLLNLSVWDQFCIWRYTVESGTITRYLVHYAPSDDDKTTGKELPIEEREGQVHWLYFFCKYFNLALYTSNAIPPPYNELLSVNGNGISKNLFQFPEHILSEPNRYVIAENTIKAYIRDIERIIDGAPVTPGNIRVYKVSTPYPEIEAIHDLDRNIPVYQKPFNSTTYDPEFNFLPPLRIDLSSDDSDDDICCFYTILIPKGSKVLSVSPLFHAYPYQREIILPFKTTLQVQNVTYSNLNLISNKYQQMILIQDPPFHIGELYRLDDFGKTVIEKRHIKTYNCIFQS